MMFDDVVGKIIANWKHVEFRATCPKDVPKQNKMLKNACTEKNPCIKCATKNMYDAAMSVLRPQDKPIDIVYIHGKILAAKHNITYNELMGDTHLTHVSIARKELYLALFNEGLSIAEIARRLNRHHTTIIAGLRRLLGEKRYKEIIKERYGVHLRKRIAV